MNAQPKCLILIQDGIGDLPIPTLDGRTPLEAAQTPCMDELVGRGVAGLMHILDPGVPVGTDVGHLALFGQDPSAGNHRRGPAEAYGVGLELEPDEIALRFNFASQTPSGRLVDRRAGRITRTEELVESLNKMEVRFDAEFGFHAATAHRGVLVLQGDRLSAEISDTDPGDGGTSHILEALPLDQTEDAARTAEFVNQLVRQAQKVLSGHVANQHRLREGLLPANCIITRGAGLRQDFRHLPSDLGVKVACISAEATVLGIARLSGADTFWREGMTAALDTDLDCKEDLAVSALQNYDLVYLHLKGCDIAGHDRQPERKRRFIEKTDTMLGRILERVKGTENLYVALAGDHATPAELGQHSGDPVPIVLSGRDVVPDTVSRYGEKYCAEGRLGLLSCEEFLSIIFDCLRPTLAAISPPTARANRLGSTG